MKQVLPDLFFHPSLMCCAFVCLLKLLLVLPTAEYLHNLTLQCKLKPPNILDLLPSAAVNIHSIYPLCWSSHTYTGCFTGHLYLSLAKASLACILFPLCTSLTQYHINSLFPPCSVFQVFGYSSIPSISRFPSTFLFGFWIEVYETSSMLLSNNGLSHSNFENKRILCAFIHKVKM